MTMELASMRVVRKPWGRTDLRPWSELGHDGAPIGELWFQRPDPGSPEPALLLKLLFTDEALSVQVHPDDDFAHAIGLPRGKTEAWYVLASRPEAEIALGLKHVLTPPQLRAAIIDGSIEELVDWRPIHKDDAVLVAAGTIHAIGAGLVIAEIQQRGDTTFRLFDFGRKRELNLDGAVGAAIGGPAAAQQAPVRLSDARLVVAHSVYFSLEQIDLAPNSHWELDASSETWLLMLEGEAKFEATRLQVGEALYLDAQRAKVMAGVAGARALVAYVGSEPNQTLLQSRNGERHSAMIARFPELGPDQVLPIDVPVVHRRGIRP